MKPVRSVSAPPDTLSRVRDYAAAAAVILTTYAGTCGVLKLCLALGWYAS